MGRGKEREKELEKTVWGRRFSLALFFEVLF
jgi:hypothetical protein